MPKRPIRSWQLWNEPDHLHYWSDQPYARGLRDAGAGRARARSRRPIRARTVVMAGFADRSWDSIAAVYRAGGKGVFDVVAIHPYTTRCATCCGSCEYARRALDRAGDRDRPLWLTEVTWSSGQAPRAATPAPFETTPAGPGRPARRGAAAADPRAQASSGWSASSGRTGSRTTATTPTRSTSRACACCTPTARVTEKPAFAEFKRIALRQQR